MRFVAFEEACLADQSGLLFTTWFNADIQYLLTFMTRKQALGRDGPFNFMDQIGQLRSWLACCLGLRFGLAGNFGQ